MVSLPKNESVQSILALFRHAGPTETTDTSTAPTAVMVATAEQNSLSTQGREVVPYEPSAQHHTRSQQKRIAAADNGDLKERLNLITIEAAEDGLRRRYCKHYPERSVLEYLRHPGDDVAPHEAVTAVLEDLADETAESAGGLALVYRYMQAHEMWKSHPDRTVRSAEDFVEYLDRAGYIRTGLVIGTAAQTAKRNSIRHIEACWGARWFEEVPSSIRDDRWQGPEDLSKNVLARIAAIAEQGRSLENAVHDWTEAIRQRNDVGARRRLDIKGKVTPYLVLADVAVPDRTNRSGGKDSRAGVVSSDEAKEERLQVELIPRQPPPDSSAPTPKYSEPARRRTPMKRKRVPDVTYEEDEEEAVDGDGWKKSKDGRWLTKRIRNQLIWKPVEEIGETDDTPTTSQDEDGQESNPPRSRSQASPVLISSSERVDSPPASPPMHSPHTPDSKTCAGPTFLKILQKLIKSFSELENPDYVGTRVCDCCRDSVAAAVYSILHEARMNAGMLDAVNKHFFGTRNVPPRREQLESPRRPRRWNTLFVGDDSESEDSE